MNIKQLQTIFGDSYRSLDPIDIDRMLLSPKTVPAVLERHRRFLKYERLLRRVRRNVFSYEDQGKLEKAQRVITKIKAICAPTWERQSKRVEAKELSRLRWH